MRPWLAVLVVVACGSDAGDHVRTRSAPTGSGSARSAKPVVDPRIAAIGDVSFLAPDVQRALDPGAEFFTPMPKPGPDDWLAQHPEPPQPFDDFTRGDSNVPSDQRHVLYLLPIGTFPDDAPSIESLAAIVRAYFTLEVRVLPAVAIDASAKAKENFTAKTRINEGTLKRQLLAPDVLTWLAKRVPDDAYAMMGVTMEDLYPEPSWNFVFGMASLKDRVGIQSFARQDPKFFGEPRVAGWKQLALRRATWTLVHEISHMFGLSHCTYFRCVVAGSNNQAEADLSPLHPCPVCLHKLWWAIRFDPAAREAALAKTLRALHIDDEAAWSERRARWIRGP